MDQQPKIPTLKDAQKPQVKIKGMGAGLTLFDRLKQFKKKDLAFILAGLGTLFMAPLAEHFMMAPENGDSSLKQGWGGPGSSGSGIFGRGDSPYESGNNGIAQGGAIGGGGDIITPLNVRDPSALVMGPGGMQQPPAGSAAPATPPPTAPAREPDYKDALAGAAGRAASAALKKAPLPVPKVALGGSGLRGLGVAGGGTSASGSLGPINSGNLGQAGTGGGGLNLVRTAPGYRSAGARGSGNPTGLDGTKKAGANAGDAFSRTGSALGGLQQAASEAIPTGGSGFSGGGQGGAGANDKAPGGGGPGGSKSVGESLAFIEAKERMMENLKLEFEKRKLKDPELLLYGIRNDSLKAMASEMTKSLTKGILGFMDPSGGAAAGSWKCGNETFPLSYTKCDKEPFRDCLHTKGNGVTEYHTGGNVPPVTCRKSDGKGADAAKQAEQAANDARLGNISVPAGATPGSIDAVCKKLADTSDTIAKEMPKFTSPSDAAVKQEMIANRTQVDAGIVVIGNVILVQNALSGTGAAKPQACRAADATLTFTSPAKSVKDHISAMRTAIGGADGKGGVVKTLTASLSPTSDKELADAKKIADDVKKEFDATVILVDQAIGVLGSNGNLALDSFKDQNQVRNEITKFKEVYGDTKALSETLKKALDNLKPAVDGLVASGSTNPGSVKVVVDVNIAFDKAVEKAAGTMLADGTTPVLKKSDVDAAQQSAPKPADTPAPVAGAPVDPGVFVAGSQKAAELATKAKPDIEAAVAALGGADDAAKLEAKRLLTGPALLTGLADSKKTQGEVLSGIGATSDSSTKAAPATAPVVAAVP